MTMGAGRRLAALAACFAIASANSITIHNLGTVGHTLVWLSNPGECAPLNDLDFVPAGGTFVKNDPILSQKCINTEWAGRFRTIPGNTMYQGSHDAALAETERIGSTIAEFCFNAFAGVTYYDYSRVNVGCQPNRSGVKWIYPAGCTEPEYQSGCGGNPAACWNAYVYSVNDDMQLSHPSKDYVVILGDDDYTHCDPTGPNGEMVCCTDPAGCAPKGPNTPQAVVYRGAEVVFECPLVAPSIPALPSLPSLPGLPGLTTGSNIPPPVPTTTSPAQAPTTTSPVQAAPVVPSAGSTTRSTTSTTSTTSTSSTAAAGLISSLGRQVVVVTATDTVWVTTTEYVCAGNPYGCYGTTAGAGMPTGGAVVKRHEHGAAHHLHVRGEGTHGHLHGHVAH